MMGLDTIKRVLMDRGWPYELAYLAATTESMNRDIGVAVLLRGGQLWTLDAAYYADNYREGEEWVECDVRGGDGDKCRRCLRLNEIVAVWAVDPLDGDD